MNYRPVQKRITATAPGRRRENTVRSALKGGNESVT